MPLPDARQFVSHSLAVQHIETAKGADNTIEAAVSTFNNVIPGFFYDDRLKPGCMAASIERGFPAVVYAHVFGDVVPIGATMAIREEGDELIARGKLFVDEHPLARQAYTAMSVLGGDGRPALREFSISGMVEKASFVEEEGSEIRDIEEFDLWEWGPCLRGANTTRLLAVDGDQIQQALRAPAQPQQQPPAAPAPVPQPAMSAALLLAVPRHRPSKED